MLTIDGVDDVEEAKMTDESMDILGFAAVCVNYFEVLERFIRILKTIGGEAQLVQMYSGYNALW
jgi:hypothetical protein